MLAAFHGLPPEVHLYTRLGVPGSGADGTSDLDFLVVHPDLGLVIVEVADAGMEPAGEHWIQRQEDGTATPLNTTPGAVLAQKHYQLLRFLKGAGLPSVPPITRVLALPALPLKPGQSLGPDLPACRLLTREKLRHPFPALQEAVSGGRPWANWRALDQAAHSPMAPEAFQALLEVLTPVLLPPPALGELMAAEGEIPDAQAQALLDHLAHNFSQGRYRVRGAPGCGKSLLGRKVARLWAAEGRKVLVLASTRALACATRVALADLVRQHQAGVFTCQELAVQLLENAHALPSNLATGLPAALAKALPAIPERWDAVVLDEAQELEPGWLGPLLGLLRDPSRDPVLVLEDPARRRPGVTAALPGQPWHLDLCLRHGVGIRRAALQALPSCGWPLPAGEDGAVQVRTSSPGSWRHDLGQLMEELRKDGVEPGQVLVLAPHRLEPLGSSHGGSMGPWPIQAAPGWWENGSSDQVRFGTVQAFQGLEADIVIYLAPAYPHKDGARLRYSALSRARHRAIVLDQALEEPLRILGEDSQQAGRPFPRELTTANQDALLKSLRP